MQLIVLKILLLCIDSFNAKFYKKYINEISPLIRDYANYILEGNLFDKSTLIGLTFLIPKKGRNQNVILKILDPFLY